jgi:C1A family cysteine protease
MKIALIITLTLLSSNSLMSQTALTDQEKVILSEMSKSVGITLSELEDSPLPNPEPEKKEEQVSNKVEPTPLPSPEVKPEEDQNSGKSIIERLKEKNRQRVREKQAKVDAKNLGLEDEAEDEENLVKKNQKFREDLKQKVQATRAKWKDKIQETRNLWQKKRQDFLKRVKDYKNASFSLEEEINALNPDEIRKILDRNKKNFSLSETSASKAIPEQKSQQNNPVKTSNADTYKKVSKPESFHLISGALNLKVRDQGKRPTCASFAGLRALEILLVREAPYQKLSEQYFYYSSKPQCKSKPCTKKGSWVNQGYLSSQNSPSPDIPLDNNCPYQSTNLPDNQTHIPLNSGCQQGFLKVTNFQVLGEHEVLSYLNNNYPVVVGLKLNPSFYDNQGFVGLGSKGSAQLDSHAEGHAVVFVGHMKLPREKISQEGEYCYIASNSWGEGWGLGGHTCLSQNWVKAHLIKGAITSPVGISYL